MTDVIFSFDTEDFTSCEAADAILKEAQILHEQDVKGCFCVVGLLAKQLEAWGRTDVLEALAHHVIASHTYGHSIHPVLNEYTDIESFDDAYAEVMRQETEGVRLIKKAVSAEINAACPPGNQKSYVAMYAYADMGIPVFADTVCDTPGGRGAFCCNIYQVGYTDYMGPLFTCGEKELRAMLDEAAKKRRVIFYTHPNEAMFAEFWDFVNYNKENKCEFGKWKECRRRPIEETERFYENMKLLVRLVKEDPRFRITDYDELASELKTEGQRRVSAADIPALRKSIEDKLFPTETPCSLSISDIFLACVDLLSGKPEHICGKVYGFLDTPYAVRENVTVSAEDMRKSAQMLDVSGFLPEEIEVGGKYIGPADWLRAALAVLSGEKSVTVSPAAALPELDFMPTLRDCSFRGEWLQSDDFKDEYLSERLRLQSWTIRFFKK